MAKYERSDDGKTVEGKQVVFIAPPRALDVSSPSSGRIAADGDREEVSTMPAARRPDADRAKATLAKAQAATLTAAAKAGAPFCEECAALKRAQ
jgi:hypothetical protein